MAMLLFRLVLWVVLPVILIVLAVGPRRVSAWFRGVWEWVWESKLAPAEVLNRVVWEHQNRIRRLGEVVQQSEQTLREIQQNIKKCEENIASLESEARIALQREEENEARAALSKQSLERQAILGFSEQLKHHKERITAARRRLHLLELQLRQYEVGRSILLDQLAEARTVEQQYALANQFDPQGTIAEWQRTEGNVQEASEHARAAEQVLVDTADLPLNAEPVRMDPAELEAHLARLREQVKNERSGHRNGRNAQ